MGSNGQKGRQHNAQRTTSSRKPEDCRVRLCRAVILPIAAHGRIFTHSIKDRSANSEPNRLTKPGHGLEDGSCYALLRWRECGHDVHVCNVELEICADDTKAKTHKAKGPVAIALPVQGEKQERQSVGRCTDNHENFVADPVEYKCGKYVDQNTHYGHGKEVHSGHQRGHVPDVLKVQRNEEGGNGKSHEAEEECRHDEREIFVFPYAHGDERILDVILPDDECGDEQDTDNQHCQDVARFPALWRGVARRQGGAKHAYSSNGQNSPQHIEALQRLPCQRFLDCKVLWHRPNGDEAKYQVYDGQQEEARSPIEDAARYAAEDGSKYEAKWVSGAEAREGIVLSLAGLLIDDAQRALCGWHGGGSHESHDPIEYVQSERGSGKASGEGDNGKEEEGPDHERFAAE